MPKVDQRHGQTDGRTDRRTTFAKVIVTRSPAVARMADRTAPQQTIYAKAVVHSCKSVQPFSRNVADKEISIAASRGLHESTKKEICVKVTDGRTDSQTDGRRTPHGCIGSLE